MANIPVKRKTPFPFWLVPVALVAVLAISAIWLTMAPTEDANDSDAMVSTQTETTYTDTELPPAQDDLINTGAGYAGDPPATTGGRVNVQQRTTQPAASQNTTQNTTQVPPQTTQQPAQQQTQQQPPQIVIQQQPVKTQTIVVQTPAPVQTPVPVQTPAAPQQIVIPQQITNPNTFASTPQKTNLVGKEVLLNNAPVGRVLSDRMFTVVSGNTEFFALLDGQLDSAGGNEQAIQIEPGQRRSFIGEFVQVPSAELVKEQNSNLPMNDREYRQLQNEQVYLHITQLTN